MRAKTVTMHFPSGMSSPLHVVSLSNWHGVVIASSREFVTQALERPEAKRCGIYLLLGEDQGGEVAYVGETEELATRIKTHMARKAWWSDVALITTKSEDLNKAHIKYLESRVHEMIKAAGRVRLDNLAPPKMSHLTESDTSSMEEFIEYLDFLLPAMGIRVLQPKSIVLSAAVPSPQPANEASEPPLPLNQFVISKPKLGVEARMYLQGGSFIMQRGSRVRSSFSQESAKSYGYARLYNELVDKGVIVTFEGGTQLTADCAFSSSSAAASVALGRSSAGTTSWIHGASQMTYEDWLASKEAPGPSTEGTPSVAPEQDFVPTPSGPLWPQEATHRITRGAAEGFGVFDPTTQLIKVLAGARFAKVRKKGVTDRIVQLFDELLSTGGIVEEGDGYRLKIDTDWMRPSPAGCLVVNQSINGWDAWRAEDGAALQILRSATASTIS